MITTLIFFRDELRDIASSDDVVFNTTEFDSLVEATTTRAIKEAVCGKYIHRILYFIKGKETITINHSYLISVN